MELASPPIFIKQGCASGRGGGDNAWKVKVPSFFASLDNKSNFLTGPEDSGVTHIQFFATGAVAKAWVGRSSVQKAIFKRMAPEAAKLEEESND